MPRPAYPRVPLLVLFAGLLPAASPAATLRVPADYPTIPGGLGAAAAGDTVLVACGSYPGWEISMKSGVCLRSETGNPGCVFINGGRHGPILYGEGLDENTRIEGITFSNGVSDLGAAVNLGAGSRASFRNCRFHDNDAYYAGGAIFCADSSPVFEDCTFSSNRILYFTWFVLGGGGGVYGVSSSLFFTDCVFEGNYATVEDADGGGLYCENSTVEVLDSVFQDNHAWDDGGGIFSHVSTVAVRGGSIAGNHTPSEGGGFCGHMSAVALRNVTIADNVGDRAAGGLYFRNSTVCLDSCTVARNRTVSAGSAGGGMFCLSSNLVMRKCVFDGNLVVGSGGGFAGSYDAFLIEGCVFSNNRARDGGGVSLWSAMPALFGNQFVGNVADVSGGAIAVGASTGTIGGNVIAGNASARGGGIHVSFSETAFRENTVTLNAAPEGAGLAFVNCSPSVSRSIVAFNQEGEAVFCMGGRPEVSCSDLYGNTGGDWVGCVGGQIGLAGNFSADPQFCDLAKLDLTLETTSPCLPERHPFGFDCDLMGALGAACGEPTAATHSTWGSLKRRFGGSSLEEPINEAR